MKLPLKFCLLAIICVCIDVPVFSSIVDTALSFDKSYTVFNNLVGVSETFMSLDGGWQFRYAPKGQWYDIQVPGEAVMQGFAIEHDKPYVYKKEFSVPSDCYSNRMILRFDGVYGKARLFVNGEFIREHRGGFTRWETDVTKQLRLGKKNTIEVEITDCIDDISYASGYAHHPIGGILRSVSLIIQPEKAFTDFYVETDLDSLYANALLKIGYSLADTTSGMSLKYTLYDPHGKEVILKNNCFPLDGKRHVIPVISPKTWDAEHPRLYTLNVILEREGKNVGCFEKKIGFREVKILGKKMLVNGKPVKLRGACRHDIHPTLGRMTTPELDSLDVMLFKESNMNFVRTSHYPPSEKFLEYCDRYGIYVESETAVCFVGTHRQKNYAPGKTQDISEYAEWYLGQCQEMVRSFRSHPSILFWSIGNESLYGMNFRQCWDWVKRTDQTRPVIFSYPGTVDKKEKAYDILSMHYQDVSGDLEQWGMITRGFQGHGIPALFDEWAHPACYTYATLQNDPNIREFWGKSLDMMWSGLFDAPGGLGGAIWGYIDETFAIPEPKVGSAFWKSFARTAKPEDATGSCVGYGEWGIVDVWRRRKPEFWSTKKAYSPVRLLIDRQIHDYVSGQCLFLPVYNRFDHSNLDELTSYYTYRGVRKRLQLPTVAAHQKSIIVVPAETWKQGEYLLIEFFDAEGILVDAYKPVLGEEMVIYPEWLGGDKLSIVENDSSWTVQGKGFEIPFSKRTGLIERAKVGGETLIEKGPFLNIYVNLNHLSGAEVRKIANYFTLSDKEWQKRDFSVHGDEKCVHVKLSGTYRKASVDFDIQITPEGKMNIDYIVSDIPNGFLRESGLSFYLPSTMDSLAWHRNGYWDYYPENDFAGNKGSVPLYNSHQAAYGNKPVQSWQMDSHEYYYWADAGTNCRQPLTRWAKGMKENCFYYILSTKGEHKLSVVSTDASVACRINKRKDEQLMLYVNNRWDYPEIAWGNYCKKLEAIPCCGRIQIGLK